MQLLARISKDIFVGPTLENDTFPQIDEKLVLLEE